MAIKPINTSKVEKNLIKEKDTTVVKSFTIQKSLVEQLENYKFEKRKYSVSQIVQEALTEYFENHG